MVLTEGILPIILCIYDHSVIETNADAPLQYACIKRRLPTERLKLKISKQIAVV